MADDWDRRRGATPVIRERVVKGPSANHKPPPFNTNVVTKDSADLQAAREFQASLGSSSRHSKIHAKGAHGSIYGYSPSSQSLTDERSAKPLARPPRQGYMVLNKHRYSLLTSDSPVAQVELASPASFMAVARVRAQVPRTIEQPAQQRTTASIQSSASMVIRPVEAPSPQQPLAPVLDPMGHLQALEASGLLSKELTDMLNNAIRTSFHAQATTKPKVTISNDAVVLNEPLPSGKYTEAELKALRPNTESKSPPKESFITPQTSSTTREVEKATNPFEARTVPLQPAGPAGKSRGFAQRLEAQKKALIGEHIHRTRFQAPVHFLIEGFKNLSLHDYTNTETATEIPDTASTKPSKATENLFGSPKSTNPTLELYSHLRNIAPAADHGAAVRTQYGIDRPLGAPILRGSVPGLPHHLRDLVPAADHGAAVRREYGIPDFSAPRSKTQTNTIPISKANETSPQPHRRSQAVGNTSPTTRPPAPTKSKPSLPAFLRGQTAGDPGAAARAQYGGKVPAPLTNNRTPSSTVPKEDNSARSRPPLPAHLRGQTVGDPGAAARAQYGSVLAPVTNSLKPSSVAPREEPLSPTKPRRGSKVNTSGFIGLAQAARKSMKEEDDPIKIASSKGF